MMMKSIVVFRLVLYSTLFVLHFSASVVIMFTMHAYCCMDGSALLSLLLFPQALPHVYIIYTIFLHPYTPQGYVNCCMDRVHYHKYVNTSQVCS